MTALLHRLSARSPSRVFDHLDLFERSRVEERAKRCAKRLLEDYGLSVDFVRDPDLNYDGHGHVQATSASNAIHELAHFLVAAKYRRRQPNYGLGCGPDDRSCTAEMVTVGSQYANQEEALASLLGILIERQIRMPYIDTWYEHAWGEQEGIREDLRLLQQRGLIRIGPSGIQLTLPDPE